MMNLRALDVPKGHVPLHCGRHGDNGQLVPSRVVQDHLLEYANVKLRVRQLRHVQDKVGKTELVDHHA